jgi:hypothetical protein
MSLAGASLGKGKYGDICEKIILELQAKGVVLIVIDGQKGSGMSLSAPYWEFGGMLELQEKLPELLEGIAASIRLVRVQEK